MDKPRRQCTATSKRTRKRCRRAPAKGALVCNMHGGSAPQVKAAADQRQTRERVEREAARLLGKAGENSDPIEHLLLELHWSAAVVQVYGQLVADLDQVEQDIDRKKESTHGEGLLARRRHGDGDEVWWESVVHPFVTLWTQERERHAKLAKLAIDAGVTERQTRLAEQYAELIARVVTAALGDPELDLPAAEQAKAKRVFARHLRLAEGVVA